MMMTSAAIPYVRMVPMERLSSGSRSLDCSRVVIEVSKVDMSELESRRSRSSSNFFASTNFLATCSCARAERMDWQAATASALERPAAKAGGEKVGRIESVRAAPTRLRRAEEVPAAAPVAS